MAKKKNEVTIHSSAAEYLTFVAATGDSQESFEIRYEDGELTPEATVKKYLTVQKEGSSSVKDGG